MSAVKDKIELVQHTFKVAKDKAYSAEGFSKLNDWLLQSPNEFISVAYEGASMGIAIKSIEETASLDQWNMFHDEFGLDHSFQIHVGLGWAFSQLNLDFSDLNLTFNPILKCRVLDGYGYYDGIFRRRQSLRTQHIPPHLSQLDLRAYDQGIGRGLWYISQGEVEKLKKVINFFSANRHHDLWRGIGIAAAYVGGVEPQVLQVLVKESGQYLDAFKSGVGLLIHSRTKANTILSDTEKISTTLFNLSCQDVNARIVELEQETNSAPEAFYFDWVKKIEQAI